jgi:hypothetical protein
MLIIGLFFVLKVFVLFLLPVLLLFYVGGQIYRKYVTKGPNAPELFSARPAIDAIGVMA